MGPLISAEQLAAQPPDVTVLDVRWQLGRDDGREAYLAGHIPGAAYVDLATDLADPPGDRGRHPLPDADRFADAMRRCGVGGDRPVVVYDDWSSMAATRAWWLLRHHGHRDVSVLDGGWSWWRRAGCAEETGDPPRPPGDFEARPGRLPVVDTEDALAVEVLVDARAPERYAGEHEPIDPVAGHVPGAVNVPTNDNLAPDGRFKEPDELRRTYAAVGAVAGADVAAYCGSGVTACHDLLALAVARVPAALYAGSWSDWVSDPGRPVAGPPA